MKNRQYRADNADKIKECRAKYQLHNADKIKEAKRISYYNHREQILERQKQYQTLRVQCCLCGESVRKYYLTQHDSTKNVKKQCILLNEGLSNTSTNLQQ